MVSAPFTLTVPQHLSFDLNTNGYYGLDHVTLSVALKDNPAAEKTYFNIQRPGPNRWTTYRTNITVVGEPIQIKIEAGFRFPQAVRIQYIDATRQLRDFI